MYESAPQNDIEDCIKSLTEKERERKRKKEKERENINGLIDLIIVSVKNF